MSETTVTDAWTPGEVPVIKGRGRPSKNPFLEVVGRLTVGGGSLSNKVETDRIGTIKNQLNVAAAHHKVTVRKTFEPTEQEGVSTLTIWAIERQKRPRGEKTGEVTTTGAEVTESTGSAKPSAKGKAEGKSVKI